MTIQLSSAIPANIRKPGIYSEHNAQLARRGLPGVTKKMLIVGQKLASGITAANTPTEVFSEADAVLGFGNGSVVHRMVRAAFASNPYISLHCVALSDHASGVAATGTMTFTGPATAAGYFEIRIGNERLELPVNVGDTAADLAARLTALVTARPDLPVTAAQGTSSNTHIVTFTAKNKGTIGNQIGLYSVQSVATGITNTIVAMASGATDPDISTALAAAYSVHYDIIASAFNNLTNLSTLATYSGSAVAILKTHVTNVSNPVEKRRCKAVIAMNGSLSLATTLAASLNSERFQLAYYRGSKALPYEIAAADAADWTAIAVPNQGRNRRVLSGIPTPAPADRLSRAEQENLLSNGVTPLEVGPGDTTQVVRSITTYTLNSSDAPDTAWLETKTVDAMDYADYARRQVLLNFIGMPFTERRMKDIISAVIAVDLLMQDEGILQNVEQHKATYVIEKDPSDVSKGRMSVPTDIPSDLHVLAFENVLILS